MKTYDERAKDISQRIRCHRKKKKIISSTCLTLAAVMLLVFLLIPYNTNPPSVQQYNESPYFDLIQKINNANFQPPSDANRLETVLDSLSGLGFVNGGVNRDDAMNGAVPEANYPAGVPDYGESMSPTYEEVTDNQVEGVIESDIIKRSSEYIYYLRSNGFTELYVYSIAQENSAQVGYYPVYMEEAKDEAYNYTSSIEMYLSADCATLTLVMDGYHSKIGTCTLLINLDVTDPANITESGRIYLTGSYLSSRMVDGDILLMSKFRVRSDCDFNDISTFVPQAGLPDAMVPVTEEDIYYPEELTNTQYTVISKLDGKTLEKLDTAAFLSYSDDMYVSADNIFATRTYSDTTSTYTKTVTEISCLNYSGETLAFLGSCTVDGSVKNQYSLDEYEGVLRVVTSIRNLIVSEDDQTASARMERNASLYCISLEDFSILASVEKFAPDNEQAESVRFDGNTAYVCTAEVITLTDPVYFFDLTDLNNITWTDTGTIDGYSSSLINLGDGFLLGIGYGAERQLKIEVYEQVGDKVVSVCAYEVDASFSEDYKSYLVDREKNLIGLGIRRWNQQVDDPCYILLHFDGYELNTVAEVGMTGYLEHMRAVLIDGWLYVFGNDFAVVEWGGAEIQ